MAGRRRKPTVPPLPPKTEPEPEAGAQAVSSPFPIVGVGASAGGLEAFTQLLQALPVDTGMGFVLVQHLAPERDSLLAEILSRATALPVTEVEDEARVEPDHVYVLPPDRNMTISGGALQLLPRKEARGQHRPIDVFLRSLAEDQGHRAIGVVLSGTANDGTLGLQEIKAAGGITFAQDDTAQQTSMPRSAVAAGCVDFVLPPEGIARELAGIARHPSIAPAAAARARSKAPAGEPDLAGILELVRRGTGVDFSEYKTSTVHRRVTRRMVLHKLEGLKDYARLLRKDAGEVEALRQDLLINVTSFFRNPETFEALKARVLTKLFKDRPRHDPLRVWVPGCSTGEEAYSLAILCAELNAARGGHRPVQIFATDLSAAGIDKARAGVYPKSIAHDVSSQRLRRFFAEVDGHYRVGKPIRDLCVFARHNLLTDPPFSQIDLISCRNLLIYLEPSAQQRILPLLHYALKPAGFLALGSSETIGSYRDLFEVEDVRHKLFAKKPGSHRVALGRAAGPPRAGPEELGHAPGRPPQAAAGTEAQKEVDRILLARFAPPGVLVNADLEIVQFRGDTGPYLAPAPGKASLHLFKMTRQSLLAGLRVALNRARKDGAPVRESGLSVESDDGTREVDLEVIPVRGTSAAAGGFLVLFEEAVPSPRTPLPRGKTGRGKAPRPAARPAAAREDEADRQNARLTQELAATREYLQSLIEQQEAANEELQSANEEAQSANEELQSVNEELETSKEEIQSSNEELATINDELQDRNLELGQLNNDLLNLLDSVQMAIVVLGPGLRVRRFTPQAGKIFNLVPADVGRPIGDVRLGLSIPDLEPLLAEVVDAVSVIEREVQDRGGRWHSLRIRPYRTLENKFDGAVILLVDVDTLRRARAFAESIVASVREPLLVLDGDLCVQSASPSFYDTFRVTPGETEGRRLYEIGNGQWQTPALRRLLEEVLPEQSSFDHFEMEWEFEEIGRKIMLLNGRQLVQEIGEKPRILLAFEDVTARRQMEETLRQRVGDLTVADRSKNEFLALLAHELRNPLAPLRNAMQVLEIPGVDRATVERAQQMMRRQVQNMARLIDDLLDVSRITQGKVHLRKEPVALAAALAGAVEIVRHQVETRRQELSLALPREPVELDADPTRLEQIFGNLLANASKFTPEGGHLWITAEPADGDDGGAREVSVRIRDDGIGMAPETLPRVFDLFMQGDRSLERARGGLGIGLTLVRRLVELHGGRVEAHSAGPGEGSEFVVRLPALPAGDAKAEGRGGGEDSPVADAARPPVAAAPRRILVVDDSVDAAESLAILLRLQGHDVREAYDGLTALAAAAKFHPEVVLLDIGLPGLDGYEVARRLRRRRRMAKALLVALTGYGQEEDRHRALEAGFDHHLIKPVIPQAVYELVASSRPVTG
ncbi:MAG TPA: chemotaxis protein CheB [Thermoanaerobaculia bacterium]